MDSSTIKIRFTRRKTLEALHQACRDLAFAPDPTSMYEELLRLHAKELMFKFAAQLEKGKERNTMTFCGTEAFAFTELWESPGVHPSPLSAVAVIAVIAAIDQYRKSPLRLLPEIA